MARLTLVAMRGAATAVYEVRILARFFRERSIVCEVATAVRRRSACVPWNAKVCKKDAGDEERSGRTGWLAFVCVCIDGHVHRVLLARYCYCIARLAQVPGGLGANSENQFAAAQTPARHLRPRRGVTARNRGAPHENRLSSILGTSSPPRERRVLKFSNVVRICVSATFLPCVLPALSAEIHW